MRYVFLGYADPSVERDWTPDELEAVIDKHAAFAARMRDEGKFVAGVGLSASEATAVVRPNGSDFVVTEGRSPRRVSRSAGSTSWIAPTGTRRWHWPDRCRSPTPWRSRCDPRRTDRPTELVSPA